MPFFFTTTYLFHFSQILGFCGYRISTLLPPPGSRLFQKCSFSAFFTPNSLQKNKLRVCGSVEMRTHCFLNFCSRFWFIASLSDIVPGHPHVPCTVLSPFLTQLYVQLYMKQTMLCSIKIQTLLLQPPF